MQNLSIQHEPVSPLLRMPIELRRQIYRYVLPSTLRMDTRLQRLTGEEEKKEFNLTLVRVGTGVELWKVQQTFPKSDRETGNDVVWQRGSIGILATNHQVHDECVDIMYGENIFVIDVSFDNITFRYRWLILSSNLMPSRAFPFLEHFSQRNLMKIKNYIINVEHVDDYTGMIKYNCQGIGLAARIRRQVENLVDLLVAAPYLNRLQVHLIDGAVGRERFPSGRIHRVQDDRYIHQSQTVLDPFKSLYGVRRAMITGVSLEYAKELEDSVVASRIGAE
ncbi:hypothetical protein BU24DRAFT_425191 [Aaosphaeria arxii CBS 175.79]|uniref:DUF7730 domain-containing protein n=1 Tax=Aaosphaeria arxii CBS 175.79 TaxID=1450172 RepID=A0A6A5XI72_9PLEO|nr:uncharacterized protein BU24DRAFT_425191 [Aaosphaeria arxii CBS 175.79]KAF2012547.1 hypothetical protein BU24DRAFT_425191 [Aaosphaeria arxii CBS 175.79]